MLYGDYMKEYVVKYINENIKSIAILSVCIAVGLVVGIFTYQFIGEELKSEIISTMKGTLDITKQENFEGINVIKNGIISNSLLIVLIYIGSLTIIAPFVICILSMFKGFAIGIYIPTIFAIFGFSKGLAVLLLLVVIPNIVYIPSYIFMCVNAINMHYVLINGENMLGMIIKESYLILTGFSIMFLSVILEQFLSTVVISMYNSV